LVLNGEHGLKLFRFLKGLDSFILIGLACPDGNFQWAGEADRKQYFITSDLDKIAKLPGLELVIDSSGQEDINSYLQEILPPTVRLEKYVPGLFLKNIVEDENLISETRHVKGELLAILNAVQDAIEVVDASGTVKYINPAFTRVTGLSEPERVNKNIFEVSPHGALAQSLIRQKAVLGYRTKVGGSDADVISNASPIFVDDELHGAVVVFQPVGDILKLMDELKKSNTIIDNLYSQLGQVSGMRWSFEALTGKSKAFIAAVESARKASRSESTILLSGESGTGKNIFAWAIHNNSSRRRKPLIVFDCSVVPDSIQELELFGCEKGAMPGVTRTRLGKIELAEKSTLFLKEINSLNPYLQERILSVIDEQRFQRIGGEEVIQADMRIVASTGDNLEQASIKGYFSAQLYGKLRQVQVNLPPLRKRSEDIPLLAELFINQLNRKLGKKITGVSPRAMLELIDHDWPGNISELKSAMERAILVADGTVIEYHHLSPHIGRPGAEDKSSFDEILSLDRIEEEMLKLALARYGESLEGKKKAAQALNISLATLYNKLKKYGD